jgi:Kef-type K+ transport system membrane component KefB
MRERASVIIGALVVLLLLFPLGYFVHISPRFPGSLAGSLVGIVAALLMLMALAYPLVKRIGWLRDRVTPKVSLATLLAIHIYAGVLGPLLGLVHSAHKFTSPLGIALVASMLVVVLSGYVGRFYLARLAKAVRGRAGELGILQRLLASGMPQPASLDHRPPGLFRRALFEAETRPGLVTREELALVLADVEYSVRA